MRDLLSTIKIWNHENEDVYGNLIHVLTVEWPWIIYLFRRSHRTWCFWKYRFRLQKASEMIFNSEWILINTSRLVSSFWKCWLVHQVGELIWKKNPQMKWSWQYVSLFTHKNGKENWPKTRFCQISFKPQKSSTQHIKKRLGEGWKGTLNFIWL